MEEKNNVDITKKSVVTCVEWFHGYGVNALGLKRAIPGLQSVAVCERDAFVVANMVSKMEKGLLDSVPIWTDCCDFPVEPFKDRGLDIFIASYPCQGFSHAGKRLGVEDHRHLWPYCRKFIGAVRPGWVWLENVEGHVSLGLSTVLADLEEDGYAAAWGIFSAAEVGAPHQRKRVFILAYDRNSGCENGVSKSGQREEGFAEELGDYSQVWPSRPGERQYSWEPPRVVGQPPNEGQSLRGRGEMGRQGEPQPELERPDSGKDGAERQTQSTMGGDADGPADGLDFPGCTGLSDSELEEIYGWMEKGTNRTDELRMCGNGVVPQTAERAFAVLYNELSRPSRPNVFIQGEHT